MVGQVRQDPWIAEHRWANRAENAHPIDEDIIFDVCDEKTGVLLMQSDLALVQRVALEAILPYNGPHESWVTSRSVDSDRDVDDQIHYLTARSKTFYDIASIASQQYDLMIELEDIVDIANAHTRQYMRDVHDYNGNFAYDPDTGGPRETIQMAQIDDWSIEEPENTEYRSDDTRGLVIQQGTHPE